MRRDSLSRNKRDSLSRDKEAVMTQSTIPVVWSSENTTEDAHLAAAAFLARYRGRTLDAYRHDLRGFFQWANDVGLDVLSATRPRIELYRAAMEERGLAASTIDR
jgi:site-specific recombinase XerD